MARFYLAAGLILTLAAVARAQEAVKEPDVSAADRNHWAFRVPVRPSTPSVRRNAWVENAIDAFVLARLEKEGLQPSAPAARTTLLRRVTFDLTGLPPTPDETASFLNDTSPGAYARVVERLLAAPRYGERWATHWLDVVRYSESNGYEADLERPHAWHYRDYVIRSLNEDKPFDRFLAEQLAGDQLAKGREPRAVAELLIAAGMHRCGPVHLTSGNVDADVNRQEVLTEMANGVGSAFLGLTMGCARCHDHKFDPVSQADYYRLQAYFAAAQPREIDLATDTERAAHDQAQKNIKDQVKPLRDQVAAIDAPHEKRLREAKTSKLEPKYREALAVEKDKRSPEQKKLAGEAETLIKVTWDEIVGALSPEDLRRRTGLRERIHALEAQLPPPTAHAWTVKDADKTPETHVLKRGDPKRKGGVVTAAVPRVLGQGEQNSVPDRTALAGWLTRPDHPLTARVFVNRLWQHHFGRGLVGTPNDFGLRGEKPSHPELLDWLACEFVSSGWSIKHMHRLMVMSNTYRQSCTDRDNASARVKDPDNRLLARMNRRRLEGEAMRDNVLAVAGSLNGKIGGPMIRVPLEPEVYDLIFTEGEPDGLWPVTPDAREHRRRSIYLFTKRNVRLPMLEAFDQPDTLTSCPARPTSTYAPQALILLNGPFMQAQSKVFAARLMHECGGESAALIRRSYQLAIGREPSAAEKEMADEFLTTQAESIRRRLQARLSVSLPPDMPEGVDPALAAALADFCLAMMNRNEFIYVQ
jgi:hypothetical protein